MPVREKQAREKWTEGQTHPDRQEGRKKLRLIQRSVLGMALFSRSGIFD